MGLFLTQTKPTIPVNRLSTMKEFFIASIFLLLASRGSSLQIPPIHSRKTTTVLSSASIATNNGNKKSLESLSVCIVGAGPSGLLVAHRLAQAGASVRLFESRPRYQATDARRAYALGIGRRGRTSLQSVDMDLWKMLRKEGFASERFDLHLPFGVRLRLRDVGDGMEDTQQEPSLLLFQNDLCRALLDDLDRRYQGNSAVQSFFDERVESLDLSTQQITTESGKSFRFDVVLGCDGVNSVVRRAVDERWSEFQCTREAIPGHYKVVRLDSIPPDLDPTAVALLLPKAGGVTAFVEPTKLGSCCVLFAGGNSSDSLFASNNTTELVELLEARWPKFRGGDLLQAAHQLAAINRTSTASLVKCNTFSYSHKAALLGDSAHATGGVSGQGVNSALVDAMILSDLLVDTYDPSCKETSTRKALLEYSIRQVPEAKALYDLSFGPKPKAIGKRLSIALKTLRDSVFKGRFGIGQLPLQTMLTTSIVPFREVRRQRDADYEEEFPDDSYWRKTLTTLDNTIHTSS